jgi:hypothetical protein
MVDPPIGVDDPLPALQIGNLDLCSIGTATGAVKTLLWDPLSDLDGARRFAV